MPEQVEWHRVRHDKVVNGVELAREHSNVVLKSDGDRIVFVTPLSPREEQETAEEVAQLARLDMNRFKAAFHAGEPPDESKVHFFLHERDGRVIGYARLQFASHVWKLTWSDPKKVERNGQWGISGRILDSATGEMLNALLWRRLAI